MTFKPFTFTKRHLHLYEENRNKDYPRPKWLHFAAVMLDYRDSGVSLKLYDAKSTVSKYLHVSRGGKTVKVRFSNHLPANQKVLADDCDYYVGVSQVGVLRTEEVIPKVLRDLGLSTTLNR